MKSKKIALILSSIFAVALVSGTFLFLYFNQDQNQVPPSSAYTLPSAQTFKVDPFPVPASGIYTSEKNGDWDFASNKNEGWIKVRNNATTTRKIGWQIDCRPDQPGGSSCWDNAANPRGELSVAPGEAWEVLVGPQCFPYQLDFTGPDFGRLMTQDTSKCNVTSTPSPSPTPTPSPSPSVSPSSTPSRSPSPSASPSRSPSASPSHTAIPSPSITASPSPTITATPSPSPTSTPPVGGPSNTPTPSPTATPTATPAVSSTPTPTPVAGASSTPEPGDRAVADATALPEAGISNGVLFTVIGGVSLLISGVFAILKKKYY